MAEAGEPVQLTKRQKRQRRAQRQQYAQYRIFVDPNDAEADFAGVILRTAQCFVAARTRSGFSP